MRAFYLSCLAVVLFGSSITFANPSFLAAERAFQFSAESISTEKVKLSWAIEPHYYLYHDQFKVTVDGQKVHFQIPQGEKKNDPTFGITEVHYNKIGTEISVRPNKNYQVFWQGCSQDGLCYPLQTKIITTDAEGLIPQSEQSTTLFEQSTRSRLITQDAQNQSSDTVYNPQTSLNDEAASSNVVQDIQTARSDTSFENELSTTTSLQWNDDRSFFSLLSANSIALNLLVFFGLGILLAFLPCSLPLIPIISSLIVQRKSGYRALAIVSSFILSMAAVYGLMGIFVAEIGYSFQRWFQSPWVISLFAMLFVIFALNLFGLFQLTLPQSWINRLNQFQDQQKAGTLVGSMAMGALSALIVGPCMSAPLAGALLFVSQNHDALMGGLYLFILGLGIGFPLFIACIFGSKLLPKPGQWMNYLKVLFGFLMLGLAVYFIRPMLNSEIYYYLMAFISFLSTLYIFRVILNSRPLLYKILITIIGLSTVYFSYSNIIQGLEVRKVEHSQTSLHAWNKVTTQTELQNALSEAKRLKQVAVIDVYADWCVACQPLENEVFPRVDVQQSLQDVYRIKLDLSVQNKSQDFILKEHEILGPPTLLIFDVSGVEIRKLRLTGTFKAEVLIEHLNIAKH